MINEIEQTKDSVLVSYVNAEGNMSMKSFNVSKYTNGFGYYDYSVCDKSDPDRLQNLKHYNGDSIKRIQSKKFDVEELREFLTVMIPEEDRNDIFAFNSPTMYQCDIELDVSNLEDEIFPDPYQAAFPICSIQITAPNLSTLVLTTDKHRYSPTESDEYVGNLINDYFKDCKFVSSITDRIVFKSIVFDSEADMLRFFWSKVNERLHFITFWNGDKFDVPYLSKRSEKNNINLELYSPTGQISHRQGADIPWWPKHRFVDDYMTITNEYAFDIWPRQSMALDWIANYILGIGKVPYDGNFRDLYLGDYRKFMFYGAVDTILVQLIHQVRNYMSSIEALSYYCKTPIKDTWKTTALCHAVIWDDLYKANMINAVPFEKKIKTSYGGGFVKDPVEKFVDYPICSDFSALYPRIMISHGMSFENYIGKVTSKEDAKKHFDAGRYVSVLGNVYDNDKAYTIKRVEQGLTAERGIYKKMFKDLKSVYLHNVEEEMLKRGLELDKKKLII